MIAAANLLSGRLPARYQVPCDVAAAAITLGITLRAGVGPDELGLSRTALPRGARYGFATAIPAAALLVGGSMWRRAGPLYQSPEVTRASAAGVAYHTATRIPLGTALPEEIMFRGALLALLRRRYSAPMSVFVSSACFGLWHAGPTLKKVGLHPATTGRPVSHKTAAVLLTVGTTTVGGVIFSLLRIRSGSLVAPWLLHAATNASGFAAGWWSANRRQQEAPPAVANGASLPNPSPEVRL